VVNNDIAARIDMHGVRSIHDFVTEPDPEIPENCMAGRDLQGVPGNCNAVAGGSLSGNGEVGFEMISRESRRIVPETSKTIVRGPRMVSMPYLREPAPSSFRFVTW
jgi:hypothetical protein